MIQEQRVWRRLMELGAIGVQDSGGLSRLAFTPEEREAKRLTASYMAEAGLLVREDEAGNLIGRKPGNRPELSPIVIGSHIDTVLHGGRFDGALGVIAGIEVLQTLQEQGIASDRPIDVIAFTDEEGARFGFGMMGSRAVAGTLREEDLLNKDRQGVTIAQAMTDSGLDPSRIAEAAYPGIHAYLELHIEQGKVLESNGLPAGIVTGIAGPLWLKVTMRGEAGHAGATPMHLRKDALAAAAAAITRIEQIVSSYKTVVGTVGQLQVKPGGINIIPSEVEFSIDLRDVHLSDRDEAEAHIRAAIDSICRERELSYTMEEYQRVSPTLCAATIQEVMAGACRAAGVDPFYVPSGAGHDAMQFQGICPIGMIFVRSKDGISHSPAEWSSMEDCGKGTELLYHTVRTFIQDS